MNGRSHLLVGGAATLSLVALKLIDTNIPVVTFTDVPLNLLKLDIVGASILGSLLADIDSDDSILSRIVSRNKEGYYSTYIHRFIAFLLCLYFRSIFHPILIFMGLWGLRQVFKGVNLLKSSYEHRSLPHKWYGLVIFSGLVYLFQLETGFTFLIPFVISYALHLVTDRVRLPEYILAPGAAAIFGAPYIIKVLDIVKNF